MKHDSPASTQVTLPAAPDASGALYDEFQLLLRSGVGVGDLIV